MSDTREHRVTNGGYALYIDDLPRTEASNHSPDKGLVDKSRYIPHGMPQGLLDLSI